MKSYTKYVFQIGAICSVGWLYYMLFTKNQKLRPLDAETIKMLNKMLEEEDEYRSLTGNPY